MSTGALEREAKLGAERAFALPDLRDDVVRRTVRKPERRLVATYFDTPDLRLWDRRITLRHRVGEGEGTGTWTLKLPRTASGPVLDRTELEWIGPPDRVPDPVTGVLRGITRRSPLGEMAMLETVRQRLILEGEQHVVLAELDDDTVTVQGGPHDGRRFRQIEVELDQADPDLLEQWVARLCEAGAWIEDDGGVKVGRAVDRRIGPVPTGRGLCSRSTVADVVRASIQAGFDRILDHEYLLRLDAVDPPGHAIHQTRVAARRLRSDLRTFRSVLDPLWVRHLRSDLEWLGDELGRVRDVDVMGQHLDLVGSQATQEAGPAGLGDALRHQRSGAAEDLAVALGSERYLVLLDKLHAAAARPPFLACGNGRATRPGSRASDWLPGVVERPWRKLRTRVRKAGHRPTDRQLHKIRIGAKQLRYAAEAAGPVVGKRARRLAEAAETLQTQLGDHHDAVVAEAWLRQKAEHGPPEAAFAAGLLAAEQIRRQRTLRKGWRSTGKRIDRRAQGWLR